MKYTKAFAGILSVALLFTGCSGGNSSQPETSSETENSSAAEQDSQASAGGQSASEMESSDSAAEPSIEAKPAQYTDRDYMALINAEGYEEGYETFGGTIKDMFFCVNASVMCYLTEDNRLLIAEMYNMAPVAAEVTVPDTVTGFADVSSNGIVFRHVDGTASIWDVASEYQETPTVTMICEGVTVEDGSYVSTSDADYALVLYSKNHQLYLSSYGMEDGADANELPVTVGNVTYEFEEGVGTITEFVTPRYDYGHYFYLQDENGSLYSLASMFGGIICSWYNEADPPYAQINIYEELTLENCDRLFCMYDNTTEKPVYSLTTDETSLYIANESDVYDTWKPEEAWKLPLPDGLTTKDIQKIYFWNSYLMVITNDNQVYYTLMDHENELFLHAGLTELFQSGNIVSCMQWEDEEIYVLMDDGHVYLLDQYIVYRDITAE